MKRPTPRAREPWTETELQRLAALLAAGREIREIAKELGRTEEGTRGRAQKDGLLPKRQLRSIVPDSDTPQ